MIDLNCNLLDAAEGGVENLGEALKLFGRARAEGVRTIVATRLLGAQAEWPALIEADREKLELFSQAMPDALNFKLGFVVKFRADLGQLLDEHGSSLTLAGGRSVLVSLPALRTPAEAEKVWQAVFDRGFSVMLARPECSLALRRDLLRLERWVESGVMLQLDAASVLGAHGREAQACALRWAQQYAGRAVVASNARAGKTRHASLGLAYEELAGRTNARVASSLLSETPAAVIGEKSNGTFRKRMGATRQSLITRLRSFRLQKNYSGAS